MTMKAPHPDKPVLVALITIVPTTMIAVAVLFTSISNNRKADQIITKTDEIHVLTNSNLSAVKTDLMLANERIQKLEKLLTDMVQHSDSTKKEQAQ